MRPVAAWRRLLWRTWSNRLTFLGTAIFTLFQAWASLPVELWNMMPEEVKALLPPMALRWLPILFFIAAMFARVIRQEKLDGRR